MSEQASQAAALAMRADKPPYRSLLWRWLRARMRRPTWSPPWRLADPDEGQVAIGYVGHGTALIQYHDCRIITDPLLTMRCSGVPRLTSVGIETSALQQVDLVLLSSRAFDSSHRKSLTRIGRGATVIVPPGGSAIVKGLGFARVCELSVGQTFGFKGVEIASTAAKRPRVGGTAGMSFVLRGGGPSIFYAGQSGYFSGFKTVGAHYQPDIALLPIGGYLRKGLQTHNMTPEQAVMAFHDLGARMMIPIRHSVLPVSYEHESTPVSWLRRLAVARQLKAHLTLLSPGRGVLLGEPSVKRAVTEPHLLGKHLAAVGKEHVPTRVEQVARRVVSAAPIASRS